MKIVKVMIAACAIASLVSTVILAGPFGPRDAGGPGGPRGECVGAPPPGSPGCPPPRPMPAPEQLEKAGATEKQISALMQFDYEQQLKRIDLRASVEKADLALNYSMRSSSVDEKALLKAVDTLNQARGELFKLDITSELQVRNILGDEVLSKMREQRPPDRGSCRRHGPDLREQDLSPREEGADPLQQ